MWEAAQADSTLPIFIVTSKDNDRIVREFFENNEHFGLNGDDIFYMTQTNTAVFDANGKVFLKEKGKPWYAPAGNGELYDLVAHSGILSEMAAYSVSLVYIMGTLNMMGQPLDPSMLGIILDAKSHGLTKVVPRFHPYDTSGVFCMNPSDIAADTVNCGVLEWWEVQESYLSLKNSMDRLALYGSVNEHVFDFNFFKHCARDVSEQLGRPREVALPTISITTGEVLPAPPDTDPNGYLITKSVTDLMPLCKQIFALEVDPGFLVAWQPSYIRCPYPELDNETARNLLFKYCRTQMGWAKEAGADCPEFVTPEVRMEISPLVSRQGENLEHYFRMNPNLSLPLHVISAAEQSRDFVIDNSANGDPWGPLARHNSRLHILQEDSILQKLESQRIFSIGVVKESEAAEEQHFLYDY
jgi:hypothetical protein